MVAIVGGNGLGLSLGSMGTLGAGGVFGTAGQGRNGELAYVNAANGNLVLQSQDDHLVSRGLDATALRTYNSQGLLNDDNGDNWSSGFYAQQLRLTNPRNTAGSTLSRTGRDGSRATYDYHSASGKYISTAGSGAHDSIVFDAATSQYVWTDGDTGVQERYESTETGRLLSSRDTAGNTLSYTYHGATHRIAAVANASAETTYYDYTGNNLTQIRTVLQGGATVTRVRYAYDTSNRLSRVTVDLTPDNNSVTDAQTYVTNYTYHGSSQRVATLTQSDGTRLEFTYVQVGEDFKVETVRDGLNRLTRFTYDTVNRRTTVTDPLLLTTVFEYDTAGQLIAVTAPTVDGQAQTTRYTYNAQGDVTQITDPQGRSVAMQYDANGNQILQRDAAGNTIVRTFDARNQVLTESQYVDTPFVASAGMTVAGDTATRSSGTPGYNAGFRSKEGYVGGAYVNFSPATTGKTLMVGLNSDPLTDNSYISLDWALQLRADGQLLAYEDGIEVQMLGAYALGDSLSVVYDGANVRYLRNGAVLRTVAASGVTQPLFADSTFYEIGGAVTGIEFGAYAASATVPEPAHVPVNVVYTPSAGMTVAGDVFTKTSGVTGWDSGVRSTTGLTGGARVDFRPAQTNRSTLVGLTTDPAVDNSYAAVDWALIAGNNGRLRVYFNGVLQGNVDVGAYSAGDLLSVVYDGTHVSFLRNGVVLLPPQAATITQPLYVDSSFYEVGARVTGIQFFRPAVPVAPAPVPTPVSVVYTGSAGMTTSGGVFTKTGGVTAWDSGVRSTTGLTGGARVDFRPAQSNRSMTVGLTTDPQADNSFASIDWALVVSGNGTLRAYRNGGDFVELGGYVAGDLLSVEYNNGAVKFWRNDALLQSFATIINEPLYVDSSFYEVGARVTGVQFLRPAAPVAAPAPAAPSATEPSPYIPSTGMTVVGDVATKASGVADWDAGFQSKSAYLGGAAVSFTAAQANMGLSIGLNTDPGTNHHRDSIDWAITLGSDGSLLAHQNGAPYTLGTYAVGDVLSVTYDGASVRFLKNNVALRTVAATITQPLYADASFHHVGARVTNLQFGSHTAVPSTAATTRYIYDTAGRNQLRYVLSAEGRATEYLYNAYGERTAAIQHVQASYAVSGLAATTVPTLSQVATWAGQQGLTRNQRTDFVYDHRGQLQRSIAYGNVDNTGAGINNAGASVTQYVYDQAGLLLRTISPNNNGSTVYTYDGLGRVLSTQNALNQFTLTQYDDANRRTTVTLANQLATVSSFDLGGRLTSVLQRNAQATSLGETRYFYDANNRLLMTQDATGVRQWMLYDNAGRKVADIDANGTLTEYRYNQANQLTQTLIYATAVSTAGLMNAGIPTHPALGNLRPAATGAQVAWRAYDSAGRLSKTVDASGAVTSHEYDAASRLVRTVQHASRIATAGLGEAPSASAIAPAVHADDRTTRHFYDKEGNLIGTLDAEGYLSVTAYDSANRLVATRRYTERTQSAHWAHGTFEQLRPVNTAPASDVRSVILYNNKGQVVGEVDAEFHLTERAYDANGNLVRSVRYARKVSEALSHTQTVASLRPTAHPEDQVTLHVFDALNRLQRTTNSEGTVTDYEYDNVGNLVRTTAAVGQAEVRSFHARFDLQGRLTGELSAEGGALLTGNLTQAQIDTIWAQHGIRYTFDAASRRTSATDANGHRTLYYYNADGQLTHTINALGEVQEQKYNDLNQLDATVIYGVRIASATLAGLNGGLASQLAAGVLPTYNATRDSRTGFTYDATGALASTTNALDHVSSSTYNAFGQVATTTQALGGGQTLVTRYAYDKRGLQTTAATDESSINAVTSAIYDAFGRMTSSTDANARTHQQRYDRLGRVVQTIDPLTASQTFTYDAFDRVLTQTDARNHTTTYAYDQVARTTTVTTPEGIAVVTARTRHGQTLSIRDGRGHTTTYAYDRNGNLKTTTDALNNVTTQVYDRANRLSDVIDARGTRTTYGFDEANRILTRTVDPGGLNLVTRYGYDAKGLQLSVTDPNGVVTQTTYDLQGQVRQVAVDPTGLNLRTGYTYDAQGRTLTVVEGEGTAQARTTEYAYDKLGRRITEIVDPGTGRLNITTRYAYDKAGNLTQKTDANGGVTRFVYDAAGQVRYTLDAENGLTESVYDLAGNVVKTIRYADRQMGISTQQSANGVLVNTLASVSANAALDRVTHYAYDADGRQTHVVDALGYVTETQYDAANNVVSRKEYSNPIALPTQGSVDGKTITLSANNGEINGGFAAIDMSKTYTVRARLRQLSGSGYIYVGTIPKDAAGNTFSANGSYLYSAAAGVFLTPEMGWVSYEGTISGEAAAGVHDVRQFLNGTRSASALLIYNYATNGAPQDLGRMVEVDTLELVDMTTGQVVSGGKMETGVAGWTGASTAIAYSTGADITLDASLIQQRLRPSEADRVTTYAYDAVGRQTFSVDAIGAVTETAYDAVGNVVSRRAYSNPIALPTQGSVDGKTITLSANDGHLNGVFANIDLSKTYTVRARLRQLSGSGYIYVGTIPKDAAGNTFSANGSYLYSAAAGVFLTPEMGWVSYEGTISGEAAAGVHDVRQFLNGTRSASALLIYNYATNGAPQDLGRMVEVDTLELVDMTTGQVVSGGKMETGVAGWTGASTAIAYSTGADITLDASLIQQRLRPSEADRVTTYAYDTAGRLTRTTDAEGFTEYYGHDAVGNKTSFTNKKGSAANDPAYTWTYQYDNAGRLTRETTPQVSVSRLSVNGGGPTQATTTTEAIVTQIAYDPLGQVLSRTEAEGTDDARTTHYVYDRAGRQVQTRFPQVSVYNATTDVGAAYAGRNETLATPVSTTYYDSQGQAYASQDVKGSFSYKVYDKLGQVRYEIDAGRNVTEYTYDSFGKQVSLKRYATPLAGSLFSTREAAATSTSLQALTLAQVQAALAPDANRDRTVTTVYDRLGRVTETRQASEHQYDSSAATGSQTFTSAPTVRNTYNAFGQVVQQATLRNSLTSAWDTSYTYYNQRGEKTGEVNAMGYLTTYRYDALGNATEQREYARALTRTTNTSLSAGQYNANGHSAVGTTAASASSTSAIGFDRVNQTVYDRLNRKVRAVQVGVIHATAAYGATVTAQNQLGNLYSHFTYDAVGNLTSTSEPSTSAADRSATSYLYYDALGRSVATAEVARESEGGVGGAMPGLHVTNLYVGSSVSTTVKRMGSKATDYGDVANSVDMPVLEHRIDLSWADIQRWGDGAVRVTVDHNLGRTTKPLSSIDGSLGATLTWEQEGNAHTSTSYLPSQPSLTHVSRVLLEKQINGEWVTLHDSGAGSLGGRQLSWVAAVPADVQVSLEIKAVGVSAWSSVPVSRQGNQYVAAATSLAAGIYEYRMSYQRAGESAAYMTGTGEFTIQGLPAPASPGVAVTVESPFVGGSATTTVTGYTMVPVGSGDLAGNVVTPVFEHRIDLKWASLEAWGDGPVRVLVEHNLGSTPPREFSAPNAMRGAVLTWEQVGVPELYGSAVAQPALVSLNRVQVLKQVNGEWVTVYDTSRPLIGERLLLGGGVQGLSAVNIAGVGTRSVSAIGGGLFAVDVSDLPSGRYEITPVGTLSLQPSVFIVRGSAASGRPVVQEIPNQVGVAFTTTLSGTTYTARSGGSDGVWPAPVLEHRVDLNWPSLEGWGNEQVRVTVSHNLGASITRTLSAASAMRGAVITWEQSGSPYIDGRSQPLLTSVSRVQVEKQVNGEWIPVFDSTASVNQLAVTNLGPIAHTVNLEYRRKGTTDPYQSKSVPKLVNGWFKVAYDDIANGAYDYRLTVRDVNGALVNLTAVGGTAQGTITGNLDIKRGAQSLPTVAAGASSTLVPITTQWLDIFGNAVAQTRHAQGADSVNTSGYQLRGPDATNDQRTYSFYDTHGRVIQTVDAEGAVVGFSYDAAGNVAKRWQTQTDADGVSTQATKLYSYDRLGQQTATTEVTRSGGSSFLSRIESTYNAFGEILTKGLDEGAQEYFDYDRNGRLWRTNQQDGTHKVYLYDMAGRATATIQSAGLNLKTGYTSAASVAALTQGVLRKNAQYDALGNVTRQWLPVYEQPASMAAIEGTLFVDRISANVSAQQAGPSWGWAQIQTYSNSEEYYYHVNGNRGEYYYPENGRPFFVVGGQYLPVTTYEGEPYSESFVQIWTGPNNTASVALPNLSSWGDGSVRVSLTYIAVNASGQAGAPRTTAPVVVSSTAPSAPVSWGHNGINGNAADHQRLQTVTGIRIEKQVNGQWVLIEDRAAASYTSQSLHWAKPAVVNATATFQYKPVGSSTWIPLPVTDGSAYFVVDFDGQPQGSYDYRVTHTRPGEATPYAESQGIFVLGATSGPTTFGPPAAQATEVTPVIDQTVDRWGNVLSVSSPHDVNGAVAASQLTQYRYNHLNQVIEEVKPETDIWTETGVNRRSDGNATNDRPTSATYYDKSGRAIVQVDANGNVNGQKYDDAGQLIAEYRPGGGVVRHIYDAFGRQVSQFDGNGNRTNFDYNRNNLLTRETQAVGTADERSLVYSYDQLGHRIRSTNGESETTRYFYDSRGNVINTRLAMGADNASIYNTRATFDAFNRKITETNGNGDAQRWTYDYFGRLTDHVDLGGNDYDYSYNNLGQLLIQTSRKDLAARQNLTYTYYANGSVKTIADNGTAGRYTLTTYEYDIRGNRSRERVANTTTFEVYQDVRLTYDELNRLKQATDNRYSLTYTFDANGNRRSGVSSYFDANNVQQPPKTYWYTYDGMNRMLISQGRLVGSQIVVDNTQGITLGHDAAGNRVTASTYQNGSSVQETYTFDGLNRLRTTNTNGNTTSLREYDKADRVTLYSTFSAPGVLRDRQVTTYNDNGWVTEQLSRNASNVVVQTVRYDFADSYDAVGNVGRYSIAVSQGANYTNTYTKTYAKFDSYKEAQIVGTSSHSGFLPGTTTSTYDANGFLTKVANGSKVRDFINNANGQILQKRENGQTEYHYYANGTPIGSSGGTAADFDFNYTPVSAQYPATTPSDYTVNNGDTPAGVALAVYGDARLWYLISDANGLSGGRNEALKAGQTLTIPNQISNVYNSSSTFKVYEPGSIIGDTTPTLPEAPPPPKDKGCGVLGMIIVAIVAVVATVLTAGALAGATASLSGMFSTGLSALGAGIGGAGSVLTAGGFAMAGAMGSIASQLVGMAIGVQEKFSWKGVALGAIGSVVGGAVKLPGLTGLEGAVGRAVVGNTISQGIGVVTGLQDKFSWRGVAASAVGGAVSYGLSDNTAFGKALQSSSASVFGKVGGQIAHQTITGIASGVTRQVVMGGKVQFTSIAADAFGNALGNALVDSMDAQWKEQQRQLAQEAFRREEIFYQNHDEKLTNILWSNSSSTRSDAGYLPNRSSRYIRVSGSDQGLFEKNIAGVANFAEKIGVQAQKISDAASRRNYLKGGEPLGLDFAQSGGVAAAALDALTDAGLLADLAMAYSPHNIFSASIGAQWAISGIGDANNRIMQLALDNVNSTLAIGQQISSGEMADSVKNLVTDAAGFSSPEERAAASRIVAGLYLGIALGGAGGRITMMQFERLAGFDQGFRQKIGALVDGSRDEVFIGRGIPDQYLADADSLNKPSGKVEWVSLTDQILAGKNSKLWGNLSNGVNQGVRHFSDYWVKHSERIPSLEERLGVKAGAFSRTLEGFDNFTYEAQRVVSTGQIRVVSDSKSFHYLPGALVPKKGVIVIVVDGKLQSMLPGDKKYFEKAE